MRARAHALHACDGEERLCGAAAAAPEAASRCAHALRVLCAALRRVVKEMAGARVVAVKGDLAKLQLTSPVCTKEGEKVALSRRVEKHWRLIGWGSICAGTKLELPSKR